MDNANVQVALACYLLIPLTVFVYDDSGSVTITNPVQGTPNYGEFTYTDNQTVTLPANVTLPLSGSVTSAGYDFLQWYAPNGVLANQTANRTNLTLVGATPAGLALAVTNPGYNNGWGSSWEGFVANLSRATNAAATFTLPAQVTWNSNSVGAPAEEIAGWAGIGGWHNTPGDDGTGASTNLWQAGVAAYVTSSGAAELYPFAEEVIPSGVPSYLLVNACWVAPGWYYTVDDGNAPLMACNGNGHSSGQLFEWGNGGTGGTGNFVAFGDTVSTSVSAQSSDSKTTLSITMSWTGPGGSGSLSYSWSGTGDTDGGEPLQMPDQRACEAIVEVPGNGGPDQVWIPTFTAFSFLSESMTAQPGVLSDDNYADLLQWFGNTWDTAYVTIVSTINSGEFTVTEQSQ